MTDCVDCVVIGAGVIGLAVGKALAESGREVLVLEAESQIGTGTSSRNSEVIHAGIYYPPGSLKARLCVAGRDALYRYCEERAIPYARCGKLIVGGEGAQSALRALQANAIANGVHDLQLIGTEQLRALEPQVEGRHALLSPSTGIVDSHALMLSLQGDIEANGGMVVLRAPVMAGRGGQSGISLDVGGDQPMTLRASTVVNAAGLAAQAVARAFTHPQEMAVPDRRLAIGHYYSYAGKSPVHHLVYPLPEDGGLGIHATLDLAGQVRFGPDVRWTEEVDYRFDDSRRQAFVDAIRRFLPSLDPDRLQPGYTGIRPKLSGPAEPPADFRIEQWGMPGRGQVIHLYGFESPGLTASLAVGEWVAALCRP